MIKKIDDMQYGESQITNIETDHHRNGSSGLGFWVSRFTETLLVEYPAGEFKEEERRFLMTYFPESDEPAVALLEENILLDPKHGIEFGYNSWRGDNYLRLAKTFAIEATHIWDVELHGKCISREFRECKARGCEPFEAITWADLSEAELREIIAGGSEKAEAEIELRSEAKN